MGKIDLKGLKGLKGSALAGLKGMYTPEGYASYIEANQQAISDKKAQKPWKNDIDIADNMYITKLIKDDIGEEEYDKQGIWNMSVAEKVDYYNNRYDQSQNPLDALEATIDYAAQKDTVEQMAGNIGIDPKDFTGDIDSDISLLPDDYPFLSLSPKEDNTRWTISEILKSKSDKFEDAEPYTFSKKGMLDTDPTSKRAEYERDAYANEYLKAMNSSYKLTSDMYDRFYKEITETDNEAAKFLKHADFYSLPLSVDKVKAMMADYYATKDLFGADVAQQATLSELQTYASEKQGWFSGANSRISNLVPGAVAAGTSQAIITGNNIKIGPDVIWLAAGADPNSGWFKKAREIVIPKEERTSVFNTSRTVFETSKTAQMLIDNPTMYEEFKNLSFFDRINFLLANNDVNRYANGLAKTGEFDYKKQQYMIEEGLSHIENIRKAGEETEFFNWNTLFDLGQQTGFSVFGMYSGAGIAGALKAISGVAGLRRAAKALKVANKLKLSKGVLAIDDITIMAMSALPSAAAEASMDAQDVYDEVMENSYNEMAAVLNKRFETEVDDRNSELWKYVSEGMKNFEGQDLANALNAEVKEHLTDEERNKRTTERIQSLMDKYYQENYQTLLDSPEFQREVMGAAMRASANTMGAETMYIATGTLLLQNTLGRGVKAIKGDLARRIRPSLAGGLTLTTEEGATRVAVRNASTALAKAKGIAQGAIESFEEGIEEGFQGVTTEVNKGLAYDYLERYLNARYDGEATDELAKSFWQNLDVAQKLIGENMFSEENVYAFLMGAAGAGLGQPTAIRGGVQLATMSKAERKSLSKKEIANMLWRNPFAENVNDNLTELKALQTEAEYYNSLLENQTIDVKALGDVNGVISWINQEAKALMNNDEVGARDARVSQTMQTLLLMDRLKGTSYATAFKRQLEAMSKMDVNNLNEGSKTILEKARTIRQDTTSQDAEILQDIKDRAKKTLNMMEQIDYWKAEIDSQFGSSIDPEVKNGLITNHVMMSDWERRIDDINKSVAEQVNKGRKVPVRVEGASEVQNAYARHGSLKNAKSQIEMIDKTIEMLEARTPKKERGAIYKSRINQLKARKQELENESKLLEGNENTVIKAEDILSLSPEARAAILDEKNFSLYSKEQQEEITKFKKDPNVTKELLQDIQDASAINQKIKHSKEELYMLEDNKGFLSKYAFEVKSEVAKRNLKTKLKTALEAKTYEEFEKAVDEYLAKGSITTYEQQVLDSVLKESQFYKKYSEHNEDLITTVNILNDSPEYLALDDNKKMLVHLMAKRALLTGQFTPDGIFKLMTDSDFIEFAKKEGVDTSFLSTDEKDAFASVISNILKQVETYNKNAKLLAERSKEKINNNNRKSVLSYIGEENEEERTILNKKRYKAAKDKYDALFTRVAEYFTNRKHTLLTKQEFVEFVSLFIDEDIDYAKIIDMDTSFNREDLASLLNEVNTWLKNKEYTSENLQNDAEYAEMDKFRRALDQILTKASTNANVARLVENAIKELNGSFRSVFKSQEKVKKLPKLEGVRVFTSKRFDRLTTSTEKKWYLDNHIKENNEQVAKLFNGTTALDATVVLINDVALANDLQAEVGELTDDNTPLIMAVRVPVGTDGAVVIDGQSYLYVGLLQNSRLAGNNRNTINDIRSFVISEGNKNGIVKNRHGKIYESKGIRIKRDTINEGEIGIRDFYLGENGRFAKEWQEADTEEKKAIVKDKIEADFKNHFVTIALIQDQTKTTENGEYVVTAEYVAPGETKPRHYTYTTPNLYETEKGTYKVIGWVDEKSPDKVYQFRVPVSSEIEIDENGTSLFDALTNIDMQGTEFAYSDANIVRKAIISIMSDLRDPAKLRLLASGKSEDAAIVSKEITKHVNRYINLLKKYSQKNAGVGELMLKVESNGDSLFMHLTDSAGTPIMMYSDKDNSDQAILKVPLRYLTDKTKEKELWSAIQTAVRDILFNENGETRVDNKNQPLAKLQVTYDNIMSKAEKDKNYARHLIFTNLLRMQQTHTGEVSVETNAATQSAPSTGDVKEDAARALDDYTKNNPKNKKLDDAIGVTTFIQDDDDVITGNSGYDINRVSSVATSLGTAIDKLVKTILYNQSATVDEIVEELRGRGLNENDRLNTWPGFGSLTNLTPEFKAFVSQVKDIVDMLAAKGETILPADYMISTEVQSGNRYARLTAEPDLITVDSDGNYHIYDFKSFYGASQAATIVKGKINNQFRIYGLANADKKIEKWQAQLSLYKLAVESKVGAGKVVELGVIPIRLGYNKKDAFISEDKYPILGVNKVFGEKGKNGEKDKALKFNFGSNSIDHKPQTRMFKDIIKIEPVNPLTISSDKWKTKTQAEVKAEMENQIISDAVNGKTDNDSSATATNAQNQTNGQHIIDSVEQAPEGNMSKQEKADKALEEATEVNDESNETANDERTNEAECQGVGGSHDSEDFDLPDMD